MAGDGTYPAWVDEDRAREREFREREQRSGLVTYRLQCAAIVRGCMNWLAWEGEPNVDVYQLDELVWPDRRTARFLRLNGWRLDRGHWLCPHHDGPPPQSESPASSPGSTAR
jgi:hypothetical protein